MKKKLALVLAAVMSLGMAVPAVAADMYAEIRNSVSYKTTVEEKYGIDAYVETAPIQLYRTTEAWDNEKGVYYPVTHKEGDPYSQVPVCYGYNLLEDDSKAYVENISKDKTLQVSVLANPYGHKDGKYVTDLYGQIYPDDKTYQGYFDNSALQADGTFFSEYYGADSYEIGPGERMGFDFDKFCLNDTKKTASLPDDTIYVATIYITDMTATSEYGNPYIYSHVIFKVDEDEVAKLVPDEPEVEEPVAAGTVKGEPSSWAKATVDKAMEAGIIPELTGGPSYGDKITREQFAELAMGMLGGVADVSVEFDGTTFVDTNNENVRKAAALGIVSGVGDAKFDPRATTNREQIASMVNRAINYINGEQNVDLTPKAADISKFTDKGKVSSWAVESVGTLAANGIMSGTSATTLSPKDSCTVEQSIMLLYRVFEAAK